MRELNKVEMKSVSGGCELCKHQPSSSASQILLDSAILGAISGVILYPLTDNLLVIPATSILVTGFVGTLLAANYFTASPQAAIQAGVTTPAAANAADPLSLGIAPVAG